MKPTQEQKKSAFEMAWAEVFLEHFNKAYGFDYVASPRLNIPATDVVGESSSGKFSPLRLELTEASRFDPMNLQSSIKNGVKVFDNNCVSAAIEEKEEKYRSRAVNISNVVLLVQGQLSKDWMEDSIHSLKEKHQNSLFKGIYYVCPAGSNESSFIMEIKKSLNH